MTFKGDHGYVYSKNIQDPEPNRDFTAKERKRIAKKDISKLYQDPILEGQYKPIDYTQDEINDFHDALSGGLLLPKRDYIINRPSQNEGFEGDGADAEPDGMPEAIEFDPEKSNIPTDPAIDPYYLMRGKFKMLLRGHKYTHEVNLRLLPMMYLPLKERRVISADHIRRELKLSGAHCVRELTISRSRLLLECRFAAVEPKQDEEDRQAAKAKRDELMNVTLDVLDSLIEDYLRLNCVLIPSGEEGRYRLSMFFYSA